MSEITRLVDTSILIDFLRGNETARYHLSHGSGFLDCLIAASAQQSNLIVCTLNDKHFRHLPGVQVERPY